MDWCRWRLRSAAGTAPLRPDASEFRGSGRAWERDHGGMHVGVGVIRDCDACSVRDDQPLQWQVAMPAKRYPPPDITGGAGAPLPPPKPQSPLPQFKKGTTA